MSTTAQILANQANAIQSTGPRTAEGKAATAKNAVKHGLTATYPVILSADEQNAFDTLAAAYRQQLHPDTPIGQSLLNHLILACWNIDRCHRLEAELAESTGSDPLLDEIHSKTLARIEFYRLRAERVFHRNLKILNDARATQPIVQNKPKIEPAKDGQGNVYSLKIGRNDQCPCRSGKKYKLCCINKGPAFVQNVRYI